MAVSIKLYGLALRSTSVDPTRVGRRAG
jgi:hypothetical protein